MELTISAGEVKEGEHVIAPFSGEVTKVEWLNGYPVRLWYGLGGNYLDCDPGRPITVQRPHNWSTN